MRFLKGLALSLLGFLLFTSLSVFSIAFMLNQTILDPDFVVSQMNKLDLSSLVKETVIDQISREFSQQFSQQFPQGRELITKVLNDTMDDLEPWIKEQTGVATYSTYDYMVGKSQSLNLVISLAPVKDSLGANLRETLLKSPPPELAAVPPAMVEQIIGVIEQQLTQEIPPTFELKESVFPPEVQNTIQQVRQGISYFQTAYPLLIGFMLLLILGIILINRQVRGTTRSLGTTFLTFGAFEYAGIFITKYFAGTQIMQFGLPPSIQAWLPQFLDDFLAPLEKLSIGLAIAGIVLIIVSIIYKREPSAPAKDYA